MGTASTAPVRTATDVISLSRDNQDRNVGVLNLEDLSRSWLTTPPVERPWLLADWDGR